MAATVFGSLPVVSEVGITPSIPTYHHRSITMLSTLESTLASLSAQVKVNSQYIDENKNSHQRREDAGFGKDGIITQFALLAVCHRKWPKHDPERQRAEQLLNPPSQPVDIELGIIHARSPPHWPLADSMELQTATPDNYDTETMPEQTRTSTHCTSQSNHARTNPSEISSSTAGPEGLDITDTAITEIYVADTMPVQVQELIINDSDDDLHTQAFHSR
ncbi:hypothetical protein F5Y03DRAFT_398730 [Xylaria venustula]|nr:hypothetical protein F5Y03DRAFT_398730 [Xylaria venustula]